MVLSLVVAILLMRQNLQLYASGFDAYTSCYRTSRKRPDVPCDFGKQNWCNIPGNSYPWHAVRQFVHENQGLMKRMYGDERHISVLRAELEDNHVEYFNDASIKEEFRRRYSKDMGGAGSEGSELVRILTNTDGRQRKGQRKSGTKVEKAIDDKSNNVLFQSHFKNEEIYKTSYVSSFGFGNKTTTTTTSTTQQPVLSTEKVSTEKTTEAHLKTTTTTEVASQVPSEGTSSTTVGPTPEPDTIRVQASQVETTDISGNLTTNTTLEELDYVSETEEPLTTTGSDALTTTDEADFDDEEEEGQGEVEEAYEDGGEEQDMMEQETSEEPVTHKAPPILRLKGINACPVKEEVVAPFWANNTRGEVLALLNLYPFEQYVHWEKCTYEHKQMFCREGCRCEQQYRLHRLLAYDPNNECRGIFSDWFRFPSCCVCKCYDLPMEFRLTSRSPRFQPPSAFSRLKVHRQP